LLELAKNIWILPHDVRFTQPAVGSIITPTQTVLVDAGNSPAHAHQISAALEKLQAPPVSYLIYTHHHWDHVLGAVLFKVPIIAHTACYDLLKTLAALPWSEEFIEAEIRQNPLLQVRYTGMKQALGEWSQVRFVLPTMTFSQQMTLHLDGLSLVLVHVGGQHAEDSIIVRVPQARVTFLGDCYYPPPYHLRTSDSAPDLAMLAALLEDQSEVYIAGHDAPTNRTEIQAFLAQSGG
jgi:glyoxylase-like metal-dependent hydrolase (beta-lactamase superfamily II)